jgi:hypothetical protein
MQRTWKRIAVAAAAVVAVGAVVAVSLPRSEAITATRVVCNGKKDHLFQVPGGPRFLASTTGFLAADVGSSFTTSDGRVGTNLGVADVFSTGSAQGLGSVTFALASGNAGPSSIVANQKGSAFPATQTMRFFFTATVDGHAYRSTTPAVVVSTAVGAFPPPSGTVYVLTNPVGLEDTSQPGKTAFVLQPGKAFTVTDAG